LSELPKKKKKKTSIAEICLFQGYVPVFPVAFYIAIDECTLATKSEVSRNHCKIKMHFLRVKIITVSLVLEVYSQGTTYTKFHNGCYTSSVPDKYFLLSKTYYVFRIFVNPS